MRVLELFAGIGGCAAAVGSERVVAAYDQSPLAEAVYRHGHPATPFHRDNLVGVSEAALARWEADLWWMSPPCQPYTVRGARRDLDDPRAASLVRIVELAAAIRPRWLALENVAGFRGSRAHALVARTLRGGGYAVAEHALCPTELGVPNRRARFYLLAAREGELGAPDRTLVGRPLAEYLDADDPGLALAPGQAAAYRHALDVVVGDGPTACFTAAYGRSVVRSGSYLPTPDGLRRFSPAEVARLLHFPPDFTFPEGFDRRRQWALLGNSLSVAAVRAVLAALPLSPSPRR